jgi:hypothetical protein
MSSWTEPRRHPRRHVEGVSDAAHAAAQVQGRRFRLIIAEEGALEEIREAVADAARVGYDELVRADGRTVYMRAGAAPAYGGE